LRLCNARQWHFSHRKPITLFPSRDHMRGSASTPLATCARRVEQRYDPDVEDELQQNVQHWQKGDPRVRRRLGDPGTIVLESDMVVRLSERLRAAPWTDVVTAAAGSDALQTRGVESALLLLQLVLGIVHTEAAVAAAGGPAQRRTKLQQSLLRQVRLPCSCCRADMSCRQA